MLFIPVNALRYRDRRDHLEVPEPVHTPAITEEVHPSHEFSKPPLLVVVDNGLRRVDDRAELLEPRVQFGVLVDREADIKPPDRYNILFLVDAVAAADAPDSSLPLEHPILNRIGTPEEGIGGEGNRLLPEPCADVLDPPPTPTIPSSNSQTRFSSQSFRGMQSASVKVT